MTLGTGNALGKRPVRFVLLVMILFSIAAIGQYSGPRAEASPHQSSVRSSQYDIAFGAKATKKKCFFKCVTYLSMNVGITANVRGGRISNVQKSDECKVTVYNFCRVEDYTSSSSGVRLVIGINLPSTSHIPGFLGALTDWLCSGLDTPCSDGYRAAASARSVFQINPSLRGGAPSCTRQFWFNDPNTGKRIQDPEQRVSCFQYTDALVFG